MSNNIFKISNLSPIILFVYNRLLHTQETVQALTQNYLSDKSELYVFSDGPKDNKISHEQVRQVRAYIKHIKGFKSVNLIQSETNQGLANSVISGVTSVLNDYGKVIVLEDDLVTAPYFLKYMNEALQFYQDERKVFSICGYNHPPSLMQFPKNYPYDVYFNYRFFSWGWGTWKDRWNKADWEVKDFQDFIMNKEAQDKFNMGGEDLTPMLKAQMEGKLDSWAIRWCFSHYYNDAFSVCPVSSYINNIGMDSSGVHCSKTDKFVNDLMNSKKDCKFILPVQVDEDVMHLFSRVHKMTFKSKIKRIVNSIISII
jgi:hypothetical protein